jgi:hypothetical protein
MPAISSMMAMITAKLAWIRKRTVQFFTFFPFTRARFLAGLRPKAATLETSSATRNRHEAWNFVARMSAARNHWGVWQKVAELQGGDARGERTQNG